METRILLSILTVLIVALAGCSGELSPADPRAGEEEAICGYTFVPGDLCEDAGDDFSCAGMEEKDNCVMEKCNDLCPQACLAYQVPGGSTFCQTEDEGDRCRSLLHAFCPCADTEMALTPFTETCDDDVIGAPACDFVVDISGEACGTDFGDGAECSRWEEKKACLLAEAARVCEDGEVVLLGLGTFWECTDDAGEADCVHAGYVYCKCPGEALPPGTPAYPEEECELPPGPDHEEADAG